MKEAWELCQQAIRADGNHGEAVSLAGLLAWQRGDYKQALPLLQKAMKLRPSDATAISNYGAVLQSLGKLEEAIATHRKAVRAEPGYVKGHTNLASALLQAERFEEAAKSFRRALDLDKAFAEAQSGLGVALQKLGQLEDAVDAHRAAVDLTPGHGILHYNLAAAELAKGDGRAALAACDAGLAQTPGDTRMLAFKVGVLEALHASTDAGALLGFERFLRAAPLDLPADCAGLDDFNKNLSAVIESHRSLQFEPPTKATRGGWQTGEILSGESGPVAAFRQCLEGAVSRYIAEMAEETADRHPFPCRAPGDWRLKGWAVVLESGGQQSAHIHPQAWLSGVYYVKIPASVAAADAGQEGWIEFGRPSDEFPAAVKPVLQLVQPQAGTLVLFSPPITIIARCPSSRTNGGSVSPST